MYTEMSARFLGSLRYSTSLDYTFCFSSLTSTSGRAWYRILHWLTNRFKLSQKSTLSRPQTDSGDHVIIGLLVVVTFRFNLVKFLLTQKFYVFDFVVKTGVVATIFQFSQPFNQAATQTFCCRPSIIALVHGSFFAVQYRYDCLLYGNPVYHQFPPVGRSRSRLSTC